MTGSPSELLARRASPATKARLVSAVPLVRVPALRVPYPSPACSSGTRFWSTGPPPTPSQEELPGSACRPVPYQKREGRIENNRTLRAAPSGVSEFTEPESSPAATTPFIGPADAPAIDRGPGNGQASDRQRQHRRQNLRRGTFHIGRKSVSRYGLHDLGPNGLGLSDLELLTALARSLLACA